LNLRRVEEGYLVPLMVTLRPVRLFAMIAVAFTLMPFGEARAASTTPQVTSSDKTVRPGLLQPADLVGFGKLTKVPLREAKLFEDPDPRGPCGAKIRAPKASAGSTVVFSLPGGVIVNSVIRLSGKKASSLMDEITSDAVTGCAAYTSTTNRGETQTVSTTIVELPPVGDQRVGATSMISVGGQTAYAGSVRMRRGDYLNSAVALSSTPIPQDVVQVLAARMDTALQRLP